MTPEQVKAARERLAKWDELDKEADAIAFVFIRCKNLLDRRHNDPLDVCLQAIRVLDQVTNERLVAIEREKQELKIDG